MNTMTHKGYTARIEFDEADNIFTGRLLGITDVIGFHGETVAELRAAFIEAVEDYLELCAKIGKPPPQARQRQGASAHPARAPSSCANRRRIQREKP